MTVGRPYTPSGEEVAFYEANGYLVTPPLFDFETLHAVREEIAAAWQARTDAIARSSARGAASKADYSRVRPELARLHLESPRLDAFCRHDQLARIARALIGDDADLSWNQAYTKAGGSDPRTAIPWHQDAWYADVDGRTFNCWIAITTCTVANGTIARAPMPSHADLLHHEWDEKLLFYRCEVDESAATPIELMPGQAFIFSGRVPHRSGVNASSGERVSYSISFTAPTARLRANRETFGDRVPIVRRGELVRDVIASYVKTPDDDAHLGAAILAELVARAPSRSAYIRATFDALVSAARRGDETERTTLLGELLAVLPESEDVLGDLVRARARVDQLMRELAVIRGSDPHAERLLVARALELAPDDASARAEWTRLEG